VLGRLRDHVGRSGFAKGWGERSGWIAAALSCLTPHPAVNRLVQRAFRIGVTMRKAWVSRSFGSRRAGQASGARFEQPERNRNGLLKRNIDLRRFECRCDAVRGIELGGIHPTR
jgi:hypothetical protein